MKQAHIERTILETLESESFALSENLSQETFIQQIKQVAIEFSSAKRIITTGMGKSGLIARKVASTLTSTGSSSVFIHPADALHGDIGHIGVKEMVLAYSNSGETREIIELLPHIKMLGGKLIAISGNPDSTLIKESDRFVTYKINKEGCPLELAPMASTTISLAIGDAIAAALVYIKEFKPADFSRFHPSGSLGKKLLTKVKDVFLPRDDIFINKEDSFHSVITKMVTTNLGAVIVLGSKGHLRGIITDGDMKRHLDNHYHSTKDSSLDELWNQKAKNIMVKNPSFTMEECLTEEAITQMHEKNIYVLPVLRHKKKVSGIIRMHDLIGFK